MNVYHSRFFETSPLPTAPLKKQTPPTDQAPPTLDELLDEATWIAFRDTALTPLFMSELVTSEQSRREFVRGCELLGVTAPKAHQLLINDALNAGAETNAVLLPRQSGKTKTLTIIALGRCAERERYNCAMTITTMATKTFEKFEMDIIDELDLIWPDEDTRPYKAYRGKGSQHIRFANGSRLSAKSPKGPSFRASSYDLVWVDEAGEASPEQGIELKAAIYSTFDTTDGQLVVTGTAGVFRREQLLYEALEAPGNGVVRYAFPDDLTADELASWEPTEATPFGRVRELTEAMHPGLHSGLTRIEKVEKRFIDLKSERFAREYGGIFGNAGENLTAIDAQMWEASAESGTPAIPDRLSIAAMPSFTGKTAALVAAWRDENGTACVYVLDHRAGTTWLAERGASLGRLHSVPIVYDKKSSDMRVEIEAMERIVPRPKLAPQGYEDVTSAAGLLVKDANLGNIRHWNQGVLNDAVRDAVRRTTGPNAWALGRPPKKPDADICALEAAALALRYFDDNPARVVLAPIMAA
jgi:hypothetical protein